MPSSALSKLLTQLYLSVLVLFPLAIFLSIWHVYTDTAQTVSINWIPSLDINLSFTLDGLSFLFASLISGVGFLVQLYAFAYMKKKEKRVSFHTYLSLFMLAMLGLVLAENVFLLFVFWELTTLTSYLLIGFDHNADKARKNALQAMLLTASGGLILLAGLIMLGEMAGSYNLTDILNQGAAISQHPWFLPSMFCIIIGAFTKSAQWPFHFWLPGAMAAPTPVSAYLHSSTMVKAGVYLLARMLPVFHDVVQWQYILTIAGAFTALWCAILAYRQSDLKLMLAYSTNVILGQLVMLIGLGSSYAITAALLLICAHSFYKAGLFMIVGNIDKATGTREYSELAGLKSVLAISFAAAVITGASKAGLPPSFGFLSKEYLYKAGLELGWALSLTMLMVNALMVALALLILIRPFLMPHHEKAAPLNKVEQQLGLWLPPIVLAILSLLVPTVLIAFYQDHIINPAASVILPGQEIKHVKLWGGINLPLILSGITVIIGIILYKNYQRINKLSKPLFDKLGTGAEHFQRIIDAIVSFSKVLTNSIQHKKLTNASLQFFVILAALLVFAISQGIQLDVPSIEVSFYELFLASFLIIASFIVVKANTLLLSVAALGTIGFITTLVFLIYSAPDVAKTQLLVETLLVVFIAVALRHLPRARSVEKHSAPRRVFHALIASTIGFSIGLILWMISNTPLDTSISDFYAATSVLGGHGRNIVNVILVDFRAFDTLGEVVVVVIASLATVAILGRKVFMPLAQNTQNDKEA